MFILVRKFEAIVCSSGGGCPGLLSIPGIKHCPEPPYIKKGFICLKYPNHTLLGREMRAGTQGRYVEAETETVMEECCHWLVLCDSFSMLMYIFQDHLPRRCHHPRWAAPSTAVINQVCTGLSTGSMIEAFSQLRFPLLG